MKKKTFILRTVSLVLVILALSAFAGFRLLQIQIVDGETYLAKSFKSYSVKQEVLAGRGKILDADGNILNANKLVYKLILQKSSLPRGKENEVIAKTLKILIENEEEWNDSLPITKTAPYSFLPDSDAEIDLLKRNLNLAVYATVDNCIYNLYDQFDIPDTYDEQMKRYIAGVRYEMLLRDFSYQNRFLFAEELKDETVVRIKELSFILEGTDVIEEFSRDYQQSTTAPHVLGTIGKISKEEYDANKDNGYKLNDIYGKSGIERYAEHILRGENGERTISRNAQGEVISDEITTPSIAGNSVKLTFKTKFQDQLQEMLYNHITWLHTYTDDYPRDRGREANAGGIVVLNAKTGAVLGAATYPSYDIYDLLDDYNGVMNSTDQPLINRAVSGLYRPGSTFKTITGFAGIVEGVITPHETMHCNKVYSYYAPSYQPTCVSWHGNVNVETALKGSCNIFFYETARRLGIDKLSGWAERFGIGQDLNLGITETTGRMTSLEVYERLGLDWQAADVIQAGIGQSETLVTPLHLAVQALTIANRGVRYQPYLIEGIYNYEGTELIKKTEPVVVDKIEGHDDAFYHVIEGMKMVANDAIWNEEGKGRVNSFAPFADIGQVAMKTGTPEYYSNGEMKYDSAVLGFFPADDPEIAIGIIIQNGEFSRQIIRNILTAYYTGEYNPKIDENGVVLTPFG